MVGSVDSRDRDRLDDIDIGEYRVMIDTGAGSLGAWTVKLFSSIDRVAGIESASVDVVVITHAHPDYVGGTLDDDR